MKKKKSLTGILLFLRKMFFNGIVILFFSFLQFYWSMGEFSDVLSNVDWTTSFLEDAFIFSAITAFITVIFFYFFSLIKNRYAKITIEFLLLISIWLFWNYSIFNSRESSWSTYLFSEEIYYVIHLSYLPILVLSVVSLFIINYSRTIINKAIQE